MAESLVILNHAAINTLLRGPSGPVVRHMTLRATRVQTRAKQLVGFSKISGTQRKGRHLRDSIVKRFTKDGRGDVIIFVGSELRYALFHHQGTRPHVIRANRKNALAFVWGKAATFGSSRVLGASFVFYVRVNHPGTAPNPFLLKALREEFAFG